MAFIEINLKYLFYFSLFPNVCFSIIFYLFFVTKLVILMVVNKIKLGLFHLKQN